MSTRHTRRPALSEEERAARMDAAHQALVDAVETIASSDDWMAMLQTARRLPSYSPRNCLLLASQGAEGMVMGYQAWKQIPATDGGTCQVARGAKGLKVLAPVTRSVTDADPVTGQEVKGSRVVGFRLISVFDETALVSPPDIPGQELLTPIVLDGDAPARLWEALAAQVEEAGYQLDTSAELAAQIAPSNGRTDFLARIVCVRPDLPPAQQLKTLAHELAHIHLHAPGKRPADLTRAMGEVEAESVAFLITTELGLDSSAYTIPYVAGWSHGDADAVLATAHRAITTARTISDQARLYLTSPDLEAPGTQVSGPSTAEPSQATAPGSTPLGQKYPEPGTDLAAEPDPEPEPGPDPDGWPDYLDDITPLSPGTEPAGQEPGETPGELSPAVLRVVRDETSSLTSTPGPQAVGGLDGVVLGTASGAWRLRWEPARAALTGVHLTGPDDPEQYVSRTVQVHAHPGEAASIGALEEQLGFALPTSIRDHLSAAQTIRPATLTSGEGGFGAIGGQRNFAALYPATLATDARSAPPAMQGSIDDRVAVGERPTPSSPLLIPGHPARTYAAALAEQPPLRVWASAGFGVQILSAAPDPGYAGHLAITYRITHNDVVIIWVCCTSR